MLLSSMLWRETHRLENSLFKSSLNGTGHRQHQDYAQHNYEYEQHHVCLVEEMNKTASNTKNALVCGEGATSLGGVKGSLPQSSQPRHQERRAMEADSV